MNERTRIASLFALMSLAVTAHADDWPQWRGPQRDGVWRELGIMERFPTGGPKVRWRTQIGRGYAGPAVAGNRVYVSDRILPAGTQPPANPFGRGRLPGTERVLCLDDTTGAILWKHEYDCPYEISYPSGPRATPLVDDGKVFALGAMGDLICLDAANGNVIWAKNFVRAYGSSLPMWGFAAHPLLDGDRLICLAGGDGCEVIALNKNTGAEIWKNLSSSRIGYSPPTIVNVGGIRELIIWDPEAIHGLDPVTGKEYWSVPFPVRAELSISQPRLEGDKLFITSFYNGSIMLKLDADKLSADVVWKSKSRSELPDKTDTLHSIMPTPVLRDGFIYGVCSYGQFRCLEVTTGKRVWESMEPTRSKIGGRMSPSNPNPESSKERWSNAFVVAQGSRYVLFNERGDLIFAELSPTGYKELDRAHIIDPDDPMPGRNVVWSHPAFAHRSAYVRNDHEIISVSLAQP